jgi:ADP-ribose pyrophosphatase YjhB (NUDIX family)
MNNNPQWLEWARRLQALAQDGLTYCNNPFDIERYRAIREIAAEIFSQQAETDLSVVRGLLAGEVGYATPKIDVRGAVFRGDKLLLVKELSTGGWTLPGGWADAGEPPGRAVEREVWEEAGYQVKAVKLLALYDRDLHGHSAHPFSIYKAFFLCELLGGEAADSIETAGANFFAEEEIPPLDIGRFTPDECTRVFAHLRHPEWATDFD